MKKLTVIGFVLSFIWIALFLTILCIFWSSASTMHLNEWGDFLAGLMAPLAVLWFIIAYFLQGRELSLNTEVLKAQQEELRRQVEETAILAKNSDRQAKAAERALELSAQERAARDGEQRNRRRIRLRVAGPLNSAGGTSSTIFENFGESVFNVAVSSAASDVRIDRGATLHPGARFGFIWPAALPKPISFSLDYDDSAGERRRERYTLTSKCELVSLGEAAVTALPVEP